MLWRLTIGTPSGVVNLGVDRGTAEAAVDLIRGGSSLKVMTVDPPLVAFIPRADFIVAAEDPRIPVPMSLLRELLMADIPSGLREQLASLVEEACGST